MRILIEEYQYDYEDVADVLNGLGVLQDVKGKVSLSYVGYFFNPDHDVNDCVFILPKVLLYPLYTSLTILNISHLQKKLSSPVLKVVYPGRDWLL